MTTHAVKRTIGLLWMSVVSLQVLLPLKFDSV
jgi:hypothetical protein